MDCVHINSSRLLYELCYIYKIDLVFQKQLIFAVGQWIENRDFLTMKQQYWGFPHPNTVPKILPFFVALALFAYYS